MTFVDRVAQFVYPPALDSEDDDRRLQRAILVVMASSTSMGGIAWGTLYWALGVSEVSFLPYGYVVCSGLNLLYYLRTKSYRSLLFVQLMLILLIPTFLQWAIGGFAASGAVMLWGFLSPTVALIVGGGRAARVWFGAFLALLFTSGILESSLSGHNVGMPSYGVTIFYVMNVFAPLSTTYFILYYFMTERTAAKIAIEQQSKALAESNNTLQELNATLEEKVRAATQELRETLSHLYSIINNLVDGLLVTDKKGHITHANPALKKLFALQEDELKGKPAYDFFDKSVIELVTKSQAEPTGVFTTEVALSQKHIGYAAATAIFEDEASEGVLGTVILIRDITKEKEVDQMKTDFISTVSHELRTPLTSVLGFTQIIKKRLNEVIFPVIESDDKKVNRAIKQVGSNVDIIITEGERLTALINDVLDIAKMEAGKVEWHMESLNISELIDQAALVTASLFESLPVELIKEIDDDLPQIMGDRDRLIQVLINLISNSAKFTDEGSVRLRAQNVDGGLVVSVVDTGTGIRAEDSAKVFERFKQVGDTLTDKPKGTGLGLPICKQIVEHHGGQIWVESEIGQGSSFSFSLNAHAEEAGEVIKPVDLGSLVKQLKTQVSSTTLAELGQKGQILVVDDEAHIRQLLRQELEAEGYVVREAQDGIEALTKVKEQRPDLMILDVMMPNISGFDVLAVLKTDPHFMDMPVIILSIVEDRKKGFRLGVDRYLTKPLNTTVLFTEIEGLLKEEVSKKKVLVVDDDSTTAHILSEVLEGRGYQVVEISDSTKLLEKALLTQPDMIVANSKISDDRNIVQSLRFEKGLENVYILLYQ